MRRASIGWQGAGLTASLALLAGASLEACGSKGTGGGSGGHAATGTGGTVATSTASSSGAGGASTSTTTSASSSSSSSSSGMPAVGDSVLMHHKNPTRDGVYVQPTFTKAAVAGLKKDTAFSATIQGPTYAQPLFVDGGAGGKDLVIIATEQNDVYALDGATGNQVWMKHVGAPVPLSAMPCGNIDPFGVTGTPVIDLPSRTIFLDAMATPNGGSTKQHLIFALSLDTGAVLPGWPVDVGAKAKSGATTFNPAPQGSRGALALVNGTLYVPYGGLYGDCGNYHGWLVAVSISDPTKVQAWATTAQAGGSWAPGGVASDGTSVYLTTGNTQGAGNTWGGGEALLRFGTGAAFGGAPADYFAPKNWVQLDNGDVDIGGSGPIVFDLAGSTPSHLTMALGKDGNAYLLDRANLGNVSNALATLHVASNEIINAAAVYTTATATYVAFKGNGTKCTTGSGDLATVQVKPGTPPTLAGSWCASQNGSGSPMVTTTDGHAEAIVWSLGAEGDQHLHAFDGDTGKAITFTGGNVAIPGMRRFSTPIAAKGRIFVASDSAVVAFTL